MCPFLIQATFSHSSGMTIIKTWLRPIASLLQGTVGALLVPLKLFLLQTEQATLRALWKMLYSRS